MKNKLMSFLLLISVIGCDGGTTTGNIGLILLKSVPYTASYAKIKKSEKVNSMALSDFKFCITQIKLENEDGDSVGGSIEARLGLIDVSNNTSSIEWGTVEVPVDFQLSKLTVEIHKDSETCSGADYSLSYKGTQLNQDIEFSFRFSPAISLDDSDVVTLGLTNIAAAIESAYDAGELDDAHITSYLESIEGEGDEE